MPPDDHSESIGYLRGRLDGHESRIAGVEQSLKESLASVWDKLNGLDGKLDTLLLRSAHTDGQTSVKREMTVAHKTFIGAAVTAALGLVGSAMQAQWHIF